MKKEQVIKAVDEAVFYSSGQINLNQNEKDFNKNVEKIARFLSANVILSGTSRNIYVGSRNIAILLHKTFGGSLRRNINYFWEGNTGVSQLIQFLNQKTDVQTLRFNLADEDLISTVAAIQKMFKRDIILQGDKEHQKAYIGSRKHVYRLKRKYPSPETKVRKYANYWIWQNENLPLSEQEIKKFIDAGRYI